MSKEKTAFVCPQGLYNFTVMTFGLANAPSSFQWLMELVLRGLSWIYALIHLDEVIIYSYSRTFEEYLKHLRLVFDRFRAATLRLKPQKCFFAQKEVKYNGHRLRAQGIARDEQRRLSPNSPQPRK